METFLIFQVGLICNCLIHSFRKKSEKSTLCLPAGKTCCCRRLMYQTHFNRLPMKNENPNLQALERPWSLTITL